MDKNKKLFPQRLWELINDEKYSFCLRWSPDGQRVYLNRNEFESNYLKTSHNQFHTQKAISFVRQMNMYGFRKVDDCYYENDHFKRNSPHLLKSMVRRHSNKGFHSYSSSSSNASQLNHHHHHQQNHYHHQRQLFLQQQHQNSQSQGSVVQARHHNTRQQHAIIRNNNQRTTASSQHQNDLAAAAAADSHSILSQSQTMFHANHQHQIPILATSTPATTPPTTTTTATAANHSCTISQLPVRTASAASSLGATNTTTSPTLATGQYFIDQQQHQHQQHQQHQHQQHQQHQQQHQHQQQQHRQHQDNMLVGSSVNNLGAALAALNNSKNLNNNNHNNTNSSNRSCCSARSTPLASSTLYHRLAALNFNQSSAHNNQLGSEHQQHLFRQLKQPLTPPPPPTLTLQQQNLLASLQQQEPNLLLESLASLGSVAAAAAAAVATAAANSAPRQHQPFDITNTGSLEEGMRPLELVVNAATDPHSITRQQQAQEQQNLLISRFLNNHLLERANMAAATAAGMMQPNSRSNMFDHCPQYVQSAPIDDNGDDDGDVDDGGDDMNGNHVVNHIADGEDGPQVIGGQCTIDYGDEIFSRNGRSLTNTSSSSSSTTNQEPARHNGLPARRDDREEEEEEEEGEEEDDDVDVDDDDDHDDIDGGTVLNLAKPSNTRSNQQQMNCIPPSHR